VFSYDLICFGELLWDIFPNGKVIGGAPYNITNRATALGLKTSVITSIGNDELGDEILNLIKKNNVDTSFIQTHETLPTSEVRIKVGQGGEPTYDIIRPVAWDDVHINDEIISAVKASQSFVYSSLGLRDHRSCDALFSLLPYAQFKICDINLRDGHYKKETILRMLRHADVLRTNEHELEVISSWLGLQGLDRKEQMKKISTHYDYKFVLSSLGEHGAVCLQGDNFYTQPVYKVDVVDTVGAGDAFLASFIYSYLHGRDLPACLRMGCVVGALTASKKGGTPKITNEELDEMLARHT